MTDTILITGASSGFGRDAAETLAAAGHRVFAGLRDIAGRNHATAEALASRGVECLEFDVTDEASVEQAVQAVIARAGHLDVLVNNAGIAQAGVTEAFSLRQVQALFDVNVFGVLRVTRAALPHMRPRRSGLVIVVGSVLGRVTFPFFGLYGASKFALEAMTDSLRYEVAPLGIEVALVQPSAYPTAMYASAQQPADAARVAAYGETGRIPGRMFDTFGAIFAAADAPNPHDVAEAITRLVAQPRGARPARVVVGNPFGADAVNAAVAPVQQGLVEGLGLGHLATTARGARA